MSGPCTPSDITEREVTPKKTVVNGFRSSEKGLITSRDQGKLADGAGDVWKEFNMGEITGKSILGRRNSRGAWRWENIVKMYLAPSLIE